MSSCLTGGGGTYGFDLEILKCPSTSSPIRTPHSSSPSSTLSESSNSPIAISTRKSRTPRKRPNQTYNEAAALLSTAYPSIFSAKHLKSPCKFTKTDDPFFDESSELLLPFRAIDPQCLLYPPILEKPSSCLSPKPLDSCEKLCHSPVESSSQGNTLEQSEGHREDDFDAESILDEEIEEGIDSIMGNLSMSNEPIDINEQNCHGFNHDELDVISFGGGFGYGFGFRSGVSPLRNVDAGGDCWWFPAVDIVQISPKFNKVPAEKKKKKKKMERPKAESPKEVLVSELMKRPESPKEKEVSAPKPNPSPGLILKLNYEEVLNLWSDRASPFAGEVPGSELPNSDVSARLAQIDLFSDGGGVREASVQRYKEKRRTRLFSKKIRYQVRKVNADQRPRMKGRFVRRPGTATSSAQK